MAEKFVKLEEMPTWNEYTGATQNNFVAAQKQGLDALGLFMSGAYNPNESISMFQTLADPAYIGELNTKAGWSTKYNNRVRGLASDVQPLTKDGKYSAHALITVPSTLNNINYPLVTNYSSTNLYAGQETRCPRFDKLVKHVQDKLGVNIAFKSLSSSGEYLTQTKKGYEIANKLTYGASFSLNEFDKLVLVSNVVAKSIINDYIAKNAKEYKKERAKYSKAENAILDALTTNILTLSVLRATDLGNPEIAYRIDEALKLKIANDLALMSSTGIDVTRKVVDMVKICGNKIATKLDFSVERIATNMRNLGFEYKKEPKTVLDAIFNATNIEKTYNIDAAVKYINKPEKVAVKPKTVHALTGAALKAGATNLKNRLPGLIDNQILTSQAKSKMGIAKDTFVSQSEGLTYILKKKYEHLGHVMIAYDKEKKRIITNTIERFEEQRTEDLGKSTNVLLNRVLNDMYNAEEKPKKSGTLIRQMVKDKVREVKNNPTDITPDL